MRQREKDSKNKTQSTWCEGKMPTNFTVVPVEDTPLSNADYDGEILKEEDKEEPDMVAEPYSGESFLGEKKSCLDMCKQKSRPFKCFLLKAWFFKHKCICKCILKSK